MIRQHKAEDSPRDEPVQSTRDRPSDSLEALVNEAMERFIRVLIRRGAPERCIQRAFRRAWLKVPREAAQDGRRASGELVDIGHVLTLWFDDPCYVDSHGDPVSLPLRGRAPSLASLIHHVDPGLDPRQVLKTLMQANAVRRVGKRYSPRSRAVAFRGTGAPLHARNLRALLGMLRTLEHNAAPKAEVPGWFEFVAENPRFPAAAREPFEARLREEAMTFLRDQDSRMLNHERKARPGEPTVRMGVGVFRFEEEGAADLGAPPRIGRSMPEPDRRRAPRRRR